MINTDNIEIGKRLYKERKKKEMSMKEVAALVGIHESGVQRYEAGLVKNVSIEKLKEFAKVLGVEASYLIGWEEEPITSNDDNVVHGFTVAIVNKLLKEGIINDKDNIPQHIIDAIINALKIDAMNKKKH